MRGLIGFDFSDFTVQRGRNQRIRHNYTRNSFHFDETFGNIGLVGKIKEGSTK